MSMHGKLGSARALLATMMWTRLLPAQSPADLILLHGHILTVDAKDSAVEALAIRDGIIVKTGTDAEVLEASPQLSITAAGELEAQRSHATRRPPSRVSLEGEVMHRRNFLLLGGVGLRRLYASSSDFWNKKDPADWTGAEKDQLTNKSPWAKEITVSNSPYGMGRAIGVPYPGYPPGMGGPRGSAGQSYKGVIRWESALPVRDALKEPLPEGFENMYVISVGGIPLNAGSRSQSSSQYPSRYPSQNPPQQQQDDSTESDQKLLDRMRGATLLEPKDKRYLQPALLVQQPAGYGNVYFGFAKDIVTLRPEDREVGFTTQFGQIQVKTKFYLKDMLYHGELAV